MNINKIITDICVGVIVSVITSIILSIIYANRKAIWGVFKKFTIVKSSSIREKDKLTQSLKQKNRCLESNISTLEEHINFLKKDPDLVIKKIESSYSAKMTLLEEKIEDEKKELKKSNSTDCQDETDGAPTISLKQRKKNIAKLEQEKRDLKKEMLQKITKVLEKEEREILENTLKENPPEPYLQ